MTSLAAAALALAMTAGVRAAAGEADADSVLRLALNPPAKAFSGHEIAIRWFGKQTRTTEMRVFYSPPFSWRRELLHPDGSVESIALSDGDTERIEYPGAKKVLVGDAAGRWAKAMPAEEEERLLRLNYDVSLGGSERIAGRDAWVLLLTPRVNDRPIQRLLVDKEIGLVLANRRFRPKGAAAAATRYSELEVKPQPGELFEAAAATPTARGFGQDPYFMTLEELEKALGKPAGMPRELPGGFAFESADFFKVRRYTVVHVRYTDGLTAVSVFKTPRPVRTADMPRLSRGSGRIGLDGPVKVLPVRARDAYYTIVSDVTQEALERAAAALRGSGRPSSPTEGRRGGAPPR